MTAQFCCALQHSAIIGMVTAGPVLARTAMSLRLKNSSQTRNHETRFATKAISARLSFQQPRPNHLISVASIAAATCRPSDKDFLADFVSKSGTMSVFLELSQPCEDTDYGGEKKNLENKSERQIIDILIDHCHGECADDDNQDADQDEHCVAYLTRLGEGKTAMPLRQYSIGAA
jgi:hypothetical protein